MEDPGEDWVTWYKISKKPKKLFCGGVTVIWICPLFGYPRTQITSVLDAHNSESVKLGQVKSSTILLKTHLSSYEALSQ